jgi:tetratricopeptide (TPR) repeat protein
VLRATSGWDAARQAYEEELALLVAIHGEGAPELASALLGLAEIANATGDHRIAIETANRVLALQPADEPEWDQAVDAHLSLAEAYVGLDERDRARTHCWPATGSRRSVDGARPRRF